MNNKSTLYKDGRVLFHGNKWTAIQMMIAASNRAPAVIKQFAAQLEQREAPRFKGTNEVQ
tara:strand:+ start:1504 stop:1683 length:180 start_codon:yes stop_codon:yes gene_type:complete